MLIDTSQQKCAQTNSRKVETAAVSRGGLCHPKVPETSEKPCNSSYSNFKVNFEPPCREVRI